MDANEKMYVVHHSYGDNESETYKLIGVFRNEKLALGAIEVLRQRPGFRDYPECFSVDTYQLNEVCWGERFGPDERQTIVCRC